jgi:hypothetical protein
VRRKARRALRRERLDAVRGADVARRLLAEEHRSRGVCALDLVLGLRAPPPSRQARFRLEHWLGVVPGSPFSAAARPVEPSPPPDGHPVRVYDRRGETLAATFDARDLHRRRGTRGLVERLRRW